MQKSQNIHWHSHALTREIREASNGHKGVTIWLTGLSASGKSTVASVLEMRLFDLGCHTMVLDGDNVRHGLNKNLGFSKEDREENIRRIAELANLFTSVGIINIAAFISPYKEDRDKARAIQKPGDFIEVYLKCPIEVCEGRDPKGLYAKARSGLVKGFTGIDDPYEPPENPEIVLDTAGKTVDQCVDDVLGYLVEKAIIRDYQEPLTIVSGLPRTGTSMMMRMLDAGGMKVMTDNIRQADIDNPAGYYEFEKVKDIKEDMSWLGEARGKAFKMVSMLLFDLPGNLNYKVIFMERDTEEMLASQAKMLDRLGQGGGGKDEAQTKLLYAKHLTRVRNWLARQPNVDVLYVNYNDVMDDPLENARMVSSFLGNGLDAEKMAGVVDKALYRNRAGEEAGEEQAVMDRLKGLGYV